MEVIVCHLVRDLRGACVSTLRGDGGRGRRTYDGLVVVHLVQELSELGILLVVVPLGALLPVVLLVEFEQERELLRGGVAASSASSSWCVGRGGCWI